MSQDEYVISPVPMDYPYEPVAGQEAYDYLRSQGYSFIHQDDDLETFQALDENHRKRHNCKVYRRRRPIMM